MSRIDRPTVRLRPKKGGRLRHGAPWAYADEIVMDRRTRAIPAGTIVRLEDDGRQALGAGAFNADSKIAVRMLDSDPEAEIGAAWLDARLARAMALRRVLFDGPPFRLVHAEADGLPGVVVDHFGPAAVVQPNAAWADSRAGEIAEAVARVTGAASVVISGTARARGLEGLSPRTEVIGAALEAPVPVTMNGATYLADLTGGQKTGLFLDQRPNHAMAARLGRGRRMLDVFTHVGGFALAALAAGAERALAVDGSERALALAREGARLTGVADRFEARRADAFDAMRDLAEAGERFGLVVADPPAFAPAKEALEAGLRAYEKVARLAAALVGPDGFLVLCSCSHAAGPDAFREASLRGVARAGRGAQVLALTGAGPDHPVHPALAETSYLKALFLRIA